MIADRERFHARTDLDHNARAFMTKDRRERAFGVFTGQREGIGVADTGRLHLDQHLAGLRPFELHRFDLERLARLECHRRAHVHRCLRSGNLVNSMRAHCEAASRETQSRRSISTKE
jgi:hypothetical protein